VNSFEAIPTRQIVRFNPVLYDSWDLDIRSVVHNLDDLPLLNDAGQEIPVYNEAGARVPRRHQLLDPDLPPCGVLLNLATCEALFNPDLSETHERARRIRVSLYPQAYLRHAGHVQANCILPAFEPIVNAINKSITRDHDEDPNESDDEDDVRRPPAALNGLKFQAYNEMVHRFTDRHGGMDVQQGTLTAAASGRFARSAKDIAAAKKVLLSVDRSLPHDRMREKLRPRDAPRDLRFEQVYTLDLHLLPQHQRNGRFVPIFHNAFFQSMGTYTVLRFIYRNVIVPLTQGWTDPRIATKVKGHLKLYKPQVRSICVFNVNSPDHGHACHLQIYPAIFEWVTYPIQFMLEVVWQIVKSNTAQQPSPYLVEIIASLERALVFAYTGNGKVLSRSVMAPLYISRALVDQGFPTVNAAIFSLCSNDTIDVCPQLWPWDKANKGPAMCSGGSQSVHYSEPMHAVSVSPPLLTAKSSR